MAYKFQFGSAIVSGSLTRDAGDLAIRNHANAVKAAITASSGNAQFEGTVSGAAGSFDAITGVSLALQGGGITAAGDIAGAGTIGAIGLASLDGGIDTNGDFTVDTDGNVVGVAGTFSGLASLDGGINVNDAFTVSNAGAVVAVGVAAGGAVSSATTVSGSGKFSALSLALASGPFDARFLERPPLHNTL